MQTLALVRFVAVALVAMVALAVPAMPVSAQSADSSTMTDAEGHLDDFVHYADRQCGSRGSECGLVAGQHQE